MSEPRAGRIDQPDKTPDAGLPAGVTSVLVFGGSFDPPTLAHIELPALARDRAGLDWLLYIPAAESPGKGSRPTAGGIDRAAMLRAALEGRERCSVSTIELDRAQRQPGPSYTVDTLRELCQRLGDGVRMRLLIGADQAASFHAWREPRQIIELAEPLVMLRTPAETAQGLWSRMATHWPEQEGSAWRSRVVELPTIDASSTEARRLLRAGGAEAPGLTRLVPEGALRVIRERGLYR